jgi:HPt (histidine-containing phosphotransfer) domain-containing protein
MADFEEYEGEAPAEKFTPVQLQDYSEGDIEMEQDLVDLYKKGTNARLVELEKTLTTRKHEDPNPEGTHPSVLHAHDIKGSSASMGCEGVRWVSGKIEHLCRQRQLEQAAALLDELKAEIKTGYKLLDDYVARDGKTGSATFIENSEANRTKIEQRV